MKKAVIPNDVWAILLLGAFGLLIFSPALSAGLVLVDDHGIIAIASDLHRGPPLETIPSVIQANILRDFPLGRVRWVYYALRVVETWLLGTQAAAWHLATWAIGFVSGLLLYSAARTLGWPIRIALVFAASVFFSANGAVAWIGLGPAETYGTLFTALALFALTQAVCRGHPGWDLLLILSAFAAGLCKESFVLLAPALLYGRVALWQVVHRRPWRQALGANWPVALGLAGVFGASMALVAWVAWNAGAHSYGGVSLALRGDSLARMARMGLDVLWQSTFFLPVLLLLWALKRNRGAPNILDVAVPAGVFTILWVLPQLVLYSTRPAVAAFYWLPAIIGLSTANVLALVWLARAETRLYTLGLACLALGIVLFGGLTYVRASRFRADGVALDRMLDYLQQNVGPGKRIVVAVGPQYVENAVSILQHWTLRARGDVRFTVLPISDPSATPVENEDWTNMLEQSYGRGRFARADVPPDQVAAIVLFVPQTELPPAWYEPYKPFAQLMEFSEPTLGLGVERGALRLTSLKSYQVLWIHTTSP